MYTILFHSNKRKQESQIISNMFKDYRVEELVPVWNEEYSYKEKEELIDFDVTDINVKHVIKVIEMELVDKKESEIQVVIFGVDKGVKEVIEYVASKYPKIKIKLISNIYEGIMFQDYERNHFLECVELLKAKKIYKMYFMKKGIANAYNKLGLNVGYLMQNYTFTESEKAEFNKYAKSFKNNTGKHMIGVYMPDALWNNNIYDSIAVAKMVENSILNYSVNTSRNYEYAEALKIDSVPKFIHPRDIGGLVKEALTNDILLDIEFTNNINLITLIAMEFKKLVLIGNNQDLFKDLDFSKKDLIVTKEEENPYRNAIKVSEILNLTNEEKEKLLEALYNWKQEYNKLAKENFEMLIND